MAKAELMGEHLWFWCQGCQSPHRVGVGARGWSWNGSLEAPTLSPSVLVRWEQGEAYTPVRCHTWIRDGEVQFLADCTHALAGQTLPLEEWDPTKVGA